MTKYLKASLDEYLDQINAYNESLQKYRSCIHEIALVGSIGAPGISDIDILIVLRDGVKTPRFWPELMPHQVAGSHFVHGPFVTTTELKAKLLRDTTYQARKMIANMDESWLSGGSNLREMDPLGVLFNCAIFWFQFNRIKSFISTLPQNDIRYFLLLSNSIRYTADGISRLINSVDSTPGSTTYVLDGMSKSIQLMREQWPYENQGLEHHLTYEVVNALDSFLGDAKIKLDSLIQYYLGRSSPPPPGISDTKSLIKILIQESSQVADGLPRSINPNSEFEERFCQFVETIGLHLEIYRKNNLSWNGAVFPFPMSLAFKVTRFQHLANRVVDFKRGLQWKRY